MLGKAVTIREAFVVAFSFSQSGTEMSENACLPSVLKKHLSGCVLRTMINILQCKK